MQQECNASNSAIEDEREESVIYKVAIHDAAPKEVAICKARGTYQHRAAGDFVLPAIENLLCIVAHTCWKLKHEVCRIEQVEWVLTTHWGYLAAMRSSGSDSMSQLHCH